MFLMLSKNMTGKAKLINKSKLFPTTAKLTLEAQPLDKLSGWYNHLQYKALRMIVNPLTPRRTQLLPFRSSKNFLWASRLWVGRQKKPILGYVPKNDEKRNLVHKGLIVPNLELFNEQTLQMVKN